MKKLIIGIIVLVLSFSSISAKESLRVAVIFDSNTVNHSSSERRSIARNLIKNLNISFEKSNLSSTIDFTLVTYRKLPIASSSEKYDDIIARYRKEANQSEVNGVIKPKLTLHYAQRYYQADIVIGIIKPTDYKRLCGQAFAIPTKSMLDSKYPTNSKLIQHGDIGIVFITDSNSCYNMPYIAAHEIGHSFGLWHGPGVQLTTNEEGHYDSSDSIKPYANGFADLTNGYEYGTLMTGSYITNNKKGVSNKFSDKTKYDCGYDNNDKCGASYADTVAVIKLYARDYNKRGDWYK